MRTLFPSRSIDPWAELARMQRDLARFMGTTGPGRRTTPGVYPPANFYQSPDAVLIRLEMPGVDPASIDITSHRNELSVAGERRAPTVEEGASYHRRERCFGSFRRTFTLPETVDGRSAEARYRDGVLEIHLPKRPEAQPRQIHVANA